MSRDELEDLIDDLFNEPEPVEPANNHDKSEEKEETISQLNEAITENKQNVESDTKEPQKKTKKKRKSPQVSPKEEDKIEKSTSPRKESKKKLSQSSESSKGKKLQQSQPEANSDKTKAETEKKSLSQSAPTIEIPASPRKKRHRPKLLKEIRTFSKSKFGSKKISSKLVSSPCSAQEHKECVLSTQQLAFRLVTLQESNNEKRKKLHSLLVQADTCSDSKEFSSIKRKANDIRDEITNNELLMGTFEHSIEAAQLGKPGNDTLSNSAAFERFIENQQLENKANIKIPSKEPTVVHSINDLPDDVVHSILQSGISSEDMEKHLEKLLAVIRFTNKQTFMTSSQLEDWRAVKIGELMLPNYGRIRKPLEHFITDAKARMSPKKIYKFINSEGKGGFGQVYFAKNRKTGKQVAIKKIKATKTNQRRQIADEVSFLSFCNHQNLVGFENVFQVGEEIWIVMHYLDGGTVNGALQKKKFRESQMAFIADQILLALKYLHSNGIVHNDLKGDNVMLTECGEVVLVDMGLCVDEQEFNPAVSIGGTSAFMSPETIIGRNVTRAADIWSLGITMLEMANGSVPFSDNETLAMFKVATKNMDPVDSLLSDASKWSSSFKNFVQLCLDTDPVARPTAEFLLQHDWLAEAITEDSQEDIANLVLYCWAAQTAPMF